MANTLTASISAAVRVALDKANTGLPPTQYAKNRTKRSDFTDGTGADQCNELYHAVRTLGASTTEDLDLAGGLTNPHGETITFTAIKAIFIRLLTASEKGDDGTVGTAAASILIGGDVAACLAGAGKMFGDASDKIRVFTGGWFAYATPSAAGMAIGAGATDVLQIQNEDASVSAVYEIILLGEK